MSPSTALLWYRRDLRVHDHPALRHAVERFDRVVPVFVVDETILGGRWPSPNRWWFLARALTSLRGELETRGANLVVVRGDPADWIPRIARDLRASAVVASRDYTPFGRSRDDAVAGELRSAGVEWVAGRGVLAHEPEEVIRDGGGAFRVFSPFHRRWLEVPTRRVVEAPRRIPAGDIPATLLGDPVELLGDPRPTADETLLREPSEVAARRRLAAWSRSSALADYDTGRDRLDREGTSRLSQDLRWGLLSPVEVLARCDAPERGTIRFRSEIAWRDFYAHLLWHEPRVARGSFRSELDGVWGPTTPEVVGAWREGRTGYPVVDAAMRQLLASGWMHNRARMIVASFLTKHLLTDWRVGERHFMEHLVDGDPASNNGGWQWAASTGTDPQPWFRIFNPTLQGLRHDPDGDYVRRWVPELRGIPGPAVHEPPTGAYVPPIVDHRVARTAALEAFERGTGGRSGPR
jgi:deoxyribodipyrimidine photo-lyase